MAMQTYTFKSKTSDREYSTDFDAETGDGSCTCPGWTFFRTRNGVDVPARLRTCTHLKQLRAGASLPLSGPAADETPYSALADAPASNAARIKPMLATAMPDGKTIDDFCGPDWRMEVKFDGFRQLVRKAGAEVTNWGRPRAKESKPRALPEKLKAAIRLMPDGIYDGEIFVPGGVSSDVQTWLGAGKLNRADNPLRFVVYDVLEIMGASVTGCPWHERHEMVMLSVSHYTAQMTGTDSLVRGSEAVEVSRKTLNAIWSAGGEGAILKRIAGMYRPGWRSTDWIKVKKEDSIVVTVTGYEAGEYGPYSKVLCVEDDGRPTSAKTLNTEMRRRFEADPDSFIGRRLVLSFTERMPTGGLRHPMFDHFEGEGDDE